MSKGQNADFISSSELDNFAYSSVIIVLKPILH